MCSLGEDPSQVVHPPHLTSKSLGSAFIPFCAYKTDLNISKNPLALPGITFPLCSAFLPTILEGQLCYELKLNATSGKGKINQLMFVLDYNDDLSVQVSSKSQPKKDRVVDFSKWRMNFDDAVDSLQGKSAKVHIGTLSPYSKYSGGIYMMSAVKRMRAKDAFLDMPLAQRNCKVGLYEVCRTRKLLEKCNCVPWELSGYQVEIHYKPRMDNNGFFAGHGDMRPGRQGLH